MTQPNSNLNGLAWNGSTNKTRSRSLYESYPAFQFLQRTVSFTGNEDIYPGLKSETPMSSSRLLRPSGSTFGPNTPTSYHVQNLQTPSLNHLSSVRPKIDVTHGHNQIDHYPNHTSHFQFGDKFNHSMSLTPRNRQSLQKKTLQRRLSEHGKFLLHQAFSLPTNATNAGLKAKLETHPLTTMNAPVAVALSNESDNLFSALTEVTSESDSDSTDSDSSSDSESTSASVKAHEASRLIHKKQYVSATDGIEWQTNTNRRRNRGDRSNKQNSIEYLKQLAMQAKSAKDSGPSEVVGYEDDVNMDMDLDELWYMEESAASSRVWGQGKKSNHFKAKQKRDYAIDKRTAQRLR